MESYHDATSDTNTHVGSGRAHTTVKAANTRIVTTTIPYLRLDEATAESIRSFLSRYDNYVRELASRASQVSSAGISTEAVQPVAIKYCVDQEYLTSLLALGFIPGAQTYKDLEDAELLAYLEGQAQTSKQSMTIDKLDRFDKSDLRTNMRDENAVSRMRNLFVAYHALLRKHGVSWVMKNNPRVGLRHVMSALRPEALRARLESDVAFGYAHLQDDFNAFMQHCLKLADAFQMPDTGPRKKNAEGSNKVQSEEFTTSTAPNNSKKKNTRVAPVCLYEPHRPREIRNLLKDCNECPDGEKRRLLDEHFADQPKNGPAANTRSKQGNIGRLAKQKRANWMDMETSCTIQLADGSASLNAIGRCDDGADDTIISPKIAEQAVIEGIGKISRIRLAVLQVALADGGKPLTFTMSRTWTCPRVILSLAAGKLALFNVKFLVADGDLVTGDLIIGFPVLRHVKVDTRTVLEQNRKFLDGTDCAEVEGTAKSDAPRQIGRLSQVSAVCNDKTSRSSKAQRPTANYFENRSPVDEFPNPYLMDSISAGADRDAVLTTIEQNIEGASVSGLPKQNQEMLRSLIISNLSIFSTTFSTGPPADVKPLKVDLVPNSHPVRVKLRNYSQEQREFLRKFVADLISFGMVYANPTSSWACAPLLVPKDGPAKFRVTVDLRPVNKYTEKHGFLMPNIEQELHSLGGSNYFAKFGLPHGYWQLPLHEDSHKYQSFVTPDGVYTPTRVLHGTTNAVIYLQSTLASLLPSALINNALYWLDDILLHDKTIEGLFNSMQILFATFANRNLKLHPEKCCFFATSIRWCGRLLSSGGVKFDPRRIDGIQNMQLPTNGAHLQQFVCALQGVKTAIPNFSVLVQPLQSFLENVYKIANSRTKRSVSKIVLAAIGWVDIESSAFNRCRSALARQVTLAHRDHATR